jgi:two-component system KDP operon response regulator KdpE
VHADGEHRDPPDADRIPPAGVLLANAGKVLTHRHLLQAKSGAPATPKQGHYLRIYVGRLRQKLEADPAQPRHLLTETGVGYRFQS